MSLHTRPSFKVIVVPGLLVAALCLAWTSSNAQPQATTTRPLPINVPVQVGTPITSLPFNINQCGRYYLNECIKPQTSGTEGIVVNADDVTIDLNGFTLQGVAGSLHGIFASGTLSNLSVVNGTVRDWGQGGIILSSSTRCRIDGIRATNNGAGGIQVGSSCLVTNSWASGNQADGFHASEDCTIQACQSLNNAGDGIFSGTHALTVDCIAKGNSGAGIVTGSPGIVRSCLGSYNQGTGISVGDTCLAESCVTNNNVLDGIRTNDRTVVWHCVSGFNQQDGIRIQHQCYLHDCIVSENDSYGIEATAFMDRIEANQVVANTAGGIKLNGCGHLVLRNSGGTLVPPAGCPGGPNDLNSLFDLGSNNDVGLRVDKPGVDFSLDPWANIGL